ncbi:MAG: class I SAM-dependent methyltransferase [Anaerolineae bacterium]|nr:class I SAM-dependent methyltransferase [Anaerolineae bacterium]
MLDWYTRYYQVVLDSRANALYCERLAGRNLYQHDFTEMADLDRLIEVTGMSEGQRVLDLGCGNGFITEYLSDQSGACCTGLDFIPEAIRQAEERTRAKRDRLRFQEGDMARLDFPPASFDILIAVDTLYFTELIQTIGEMKRVLAPGGQMALFYAHGWVPWESLDAFPRDSTLPDRTPLALALQAHGLAYRTWDYTQADYAHAQRKQRIAEDLRDAFEAEGNLFLYENHQGEAVGVQRAIEANAHTRYLYHVTTLSNS